MDLLARLSAALAKRYEIPREIGRGGMSVVCLARDLSLDREVALKTSRAELTVSVGAGRFQREIQLVAHIEHIHLLLPIRSGAVSGVPLRSVRGMGAGGRRNLPSSTRSPSCQCAYCRA